MNSMTVHIVIDAEWRSIELTGNLGVLIPLIEKYYGLSDKEKFTKEEIQNWVKENKTVAIQDTWLTIKEV